MDKLVFSAEALAKSIGIDGKNEIVFEEYFDVQKSEGGTPKDPKFEYFKKKVLDHLAELEKRESGSVAKSIDVEEWILKANFPVGTVRTWNGQKFKKISPKKWARIYEGESRGAKLAIAALRRKAAACKNSEELYQLCLANMERFRDNNGHPLPFMQEFSEYVSGLNDAHEKGKAKAEYDQYYKQIKSHLTTSYRSKASKEQYLREKQLDMVDNPDELDETLRPRYEAMLDLFKEVTGKDYQKQDPKTASKPTEPAKEEPKEKTFSVIRGGKEIKIPELKIKQNIEDLNEQITDVDTKLKDISFKKYWKSYEREKKDLESTLKVQRDMLESLERGDFGETAESENKGDGYPEKDYPEYRGKGQKAVDFIAKNKSGQVRGAFNRKEIGDIDIVWGEITDKNKHEGYGLAHIVDKHGEDSLSAIGDVIDNGEFSLNSSNGRASFEKDGFKVAIRRSYNGKEKTWVVTGFKKENGTSTIPSSAKNYTAETSPKPSDSNISQNEEKSSGKKGIESIREKYQSSLSVEGDEDEIYVGKEAIQGKWKLVEADAPSASHDELTFRKTEGFPTAKDGGTVNDRDYEHDTAAQEAVLDMSADFDGRALGFDSPIVVTQDGVVTSGNNRTMSSKLAARKGTDSKYIDALKKRAKKFGFSAEDVAKFKHPRVVFETNHSGDYTTDEFAKYNESGKKAKSPIEKAVEVSKRIKPEIIESVAASIGSFDTMGELWADRKAAEGIFNALVQSGMIQKTDLPQYYADGGVTESGKEFVETVLIGSVVNETNIRALNGAKSIRQKLVRAIVPLVENKGMKGYSINKELNEAVAIAVEVANEKAKKEPAFRTVEAYAQQKDMFKQADPVAVELAKKLDGRTQKEFADFMLEMNGGLRPAANGEVDLFLGETESKEDIVNRVLKIGKTVQKALERFFARLGATA